MTFWYLASPYSGHPGGMEVAYREACAATAVLIRAGIPVFSPIAHSHGIALHGGIDPVSHDIWLPADEPMMRAAMGLIILRIAGWDTSMGVEAEYQAFTKAGKPVQYMDTGRAPALGYSAIMGELAAIEAARPADGEPLYPMFGTMGADRT